MRGKLLKIRKIMGREDFVASFHDEMWPRPFWAEIHALVIPEKDTLGKLVIAAEVTKVLRLPDEKDHAGFLKHEIEIKLIKTFREMYMAEALSGLEGDSHSDLETA